MKLAAQLYTVRDFTKTEKDIFDTLKRIKNIGYKVVQISGFGEFNAKNVKKMLDELNLEVFATHTSLDRIIFDTDKVIEEHLTLGAKYVGLGYHADKGIDECRKFLDSLLKPVDKMFDNGLKFLYHNHKHEFIKLDGVRPIDFYKDNTDVNKFGFLADFYWVQSGGEFPTEFIKKFEGRLDAVHYKDMRANDGNNMAEVFEGNMDYRLIHEACLKAGVKYAAVEQDTCDGNPFDSLKLSFDNIKRNFLSFN